MTDHLTEACRLLDESVAQAVGLDPALLAQVHATLEVAEHVEYAGEQLRRLADAVEALVAEFRPLVEQRHVSVNLDGVDPSAMTSAIVEAARRAYGASSDAARHEPPAAAPCAVVLDDEFGRRPCAIFFENHYAITDHEWIGHATATGESGLSKSPDGSR